LTEAGDLFLTEKPEKEEGRGFVAAEENLGREMGSVQRKGEEGEVW
jgi:hypothetical protein